MYFLNEIIKVKKRKKFEVVAYEWLEYKKMEIKNSTYCNYKFIIERYLKSEFGGKDIDKIHDFNEFIEKLVDKLSPKTIRDITNVLKAILIYYEEIYGKKLKYKKMKIPKLEKKTIRILSKREKEKLEKCCLDSNDLKLFGIIVCLNTGIRLGELCALKWKNIDLNERVIYIKHTIQRVYIGKGVKSEIIIDTPKTKSSIREIPINNKLYFILKPLSKMYENEAFFLTGLTEKPIEPRNYQMLFKSILKKCKIRNYKFHILRHTFATNCIEVGMDIKTLSQILGHSNVQITLNIYVHSSKKLMKKYLEKI